MDAIRAGQLCPGTAALRAKDQARGMPWSVGKGKRNAGKEDERQLEYLRATCHCHEESPFASMQ